VIAKNWEGGAHGIGMSQRKALCDTALVTANVIVYWAEVLKDEMKRQNIERHAKRIPTKDGGMRRSKYFDNYTTDDNETITFERGQLRRLLDQMAEQIVRLRRFETKTPGRPT
jgi:hypothetical protein